MFDVPPPRPSPLAPQPSANIQCLPYQPLDQLAGSLSAADLHVVVMGDAFVGLVHPCKIYNILSVAAPVLYIGPRPSHLSEMLDRISREYPCASAVMVRLTEVVRADSSGSGSNPPGPARQTLPHLCAPFSKEALLPKLIAELESA